MVIPLTILIAFSRMYLYVHFPSDILGGAVLGITIGALTYVYGNKDFKNKKRIIHKIKILVIRNYNHIKLF